MRAYELAALVAIAVLLVLVIYIAGAKGEKRRLSLISADGGRVFVDAEIARDGAVMAKGLMGRDSLGINEGMLFMFPGDGRHAFWMLNTTIPLDAIYISRNGTVVDVVAMEPCGLNVTKCRTYVPKSPARYVLEVNMGFSARNGILPGKSSLDLATIENSK
jgi:uncharacterized protein